MQSNKFNEEELKKKLTPEEYRVLRERGTEAPFAGEYVNEHSKGMYKCKVCDAVLFSSDAKFDSGTGWPSFTDPANTKNIELKTDESHDMNRTEVLCKNCGSHLGHVFNDGPTNMDGKKTSGQRFCINSVCLKLEKE